MSREAANIAGDDGLDLPLHGVHLLEASAGTGKTFALATLFLRLVVERELRIAQVLAVTFTEAATQELRKRIRERLELAAQQVGVEAGKDAPAEVRISRAILQRHLQSSGESAASVQRRLRIAAAEIDLASIFTIHGFCARTLREHALECGADFAPRELLASLKPLLEEVAADLWRRHAVSARDAEDLLELWPQGPADLASDLDGLLQHENLQPPRRALAEDALPRVQRAAQALAQAVVRDGDAFFDAVQSAVAAGVLNRNSYAKSPWLPALCAELRQWSVSAEPLEVPTTKLDLLTEAALVEKTLKAHAGKTPASPLSRPIGDYLAARAAYDVQRAQRRVNLLHEVRDEARSRLQALKTQRGVQGYDDLIDGVAGALQRDAEALRNVLRKQYAVALVDEFQDTDARQWAIFNALFGQASQAPALYLIGDPKQAIYGFRGGDVHTYLQAREAAVIAPALAHNFRSRPGVLRAIEALYAIAGFEGAAGAFRTEGIAFHPVQPGGRRDDADFLRDGRPAKALTLRVLPPDGDGPLKADASRARATQACVVAIHALLRDAQAGKASINGRRVQPGDVAVLVRSHHEAMRIRDALVRAGIPAVAAGRKSLFASDEAQELRTLLLALQQPGNAARLRALLATVLLGESAASIAAMQDDADRLGHAQEQLVHWRERCVRGGIHALVGDLCAQQAPRLMRLLDGERRLSNYLQLGEAMQEAAMHAGSLDELLDVLQQRIAAADDRDETQQLRLESDAHRVQVITLHKSKGLEYAFVCLPYAGIGRDDKVKGRQLVVHEGDARVLHRKTDGEGWNLAKAAHLQDQREEEARLLYVGLTRAQHALWLACGPFFNAERTALAPMLRDMPGLRACADIDIIEAPVDAVPPRLQWQDEVEVAAAREARALPAFDWWVHSFSQLARADSGAIDTAPVQGDSAANDEVALEEVDEVAEPDASLRRFGGTGFGTAVHKALEDADFAAWRSWHAGDVAPAGEVDGLRAALRGNGMPESDIEPGMALMTRLIGQSLTVRLPEGVRLCDVPEAQRRTEIEFHFSLEATPVAQLLQLLHAHGVVPRRREFGTRRVLEGLMNGKIDLTYFHGGKCYVLDWKSNWLGERASDYAPAKLQQAMEEAEYDLQALLYTLAVHRWLRFRRGDAYDYARDFGGIRYLFCRGIDAAGDPARGVFAQRFPLALVQALDELFAGNAAGSAA